MAHLHQPTRRSRLAQRLLAAARVFAASCRGGTDPEAVTRIVVGTLASPASAALTVPDTVTMGHAFDVTVRTQGNSCVQAAGGEARVAGLVATVTPFDMVYSGLCTDILTSPSRAVPVRFDVGGTVTIRAVGANGTTAERSVVVRPLR